MENWLDFMMLLDSSSDSSVTFLNVSVALNFIGAFILVGALLPPFFDTKKTKQTYGLSDTFFMNFVISNACMIVNAIMNVVLNGGKDDSLPVMIMFGLFLAINSLSIYLNSYILKIKKQNMAAAAAKGISEQEYWEKYLSGKAA